MLIVLMDFLILNRLRLTTARSHIPVKFYLSLREFYNCKLINQYCGYIFTNKILMLIALMYFLILNRMRLTAARSHIPVKFYLSLREFYNCKIDKSILWLC